MERICQQLKEIIFVSMKDNGYIVEENYDRGQIFAFYKEYDYICSCMKNGALWYPQDTNFRDEIEHITKLYHDIINLYEQYDTAIPLFCKGLTEYNVLSELGDTVLAAKLCYDHRFEIVTWKYIDNGSGVCHGNYHGNNYVEAKRDFVSRSGLLPKSEVFSKEELKLIYQTCLYRGKNDNNMEFREELELTRLREKIEENELFSVEEVDDKEVQEEQDKQETWEIFS